MLSRLTVELEKNENINVNMSSLFQGVIMEKIDNDYGEYLHSGGRKPYTQHLEITKDACNWIITTLCESANKNIIEKLINDMPGKIVLRHNGLEIGIKGYKEQKISYKELLDKTFFAECERTVNVKFITPTAFKVNGGYQFYPSVYHIFYSLIGKYDEVSVDNEIYSDEIMEQITENVQIIKYNLSSYTFHLEGVKIPAFRGSIRLKINGPQQFVNLIHLLLSFGEYSGVGIKNAIGMGSICIV